MTAAVRRREIEEQQPLKTGRVSPDKIRFRTGNRGLGDLRDLAESLKQEGVLQPLLVHRIGDTFEVLDGHRRLAAARLAGLRTVPVLIVGQRSHSDAINIMVATAMHTKGLESGERAQAISELVNRHGWTIADLAVRWGVSPGTVQRWKTAGDDEPSHFTSAHTGPTSSVRPRRAPSTVGVRRLADVVDRWEKQCGPNGLSLDDAAALLAELRGLLPVAAERAA